MKHIVVTTVCIAIMIFFGMLVHGCARCQAGKTICGGAYPELVSG